MRVGGGEGSGAYKRQFAIPVFSSFQGCMCCEKFLSLDNICSSFEAHSFTCTLLLENCLLLRTGNIHGQTFNTCKHMLASNGGYCSYVLYTVFINFAFFVAVSDLVREEVAHQS